MTFTVRPEEDEADRAFIRGLNPRLCGVIDAPTHSREEIEAFQDRFTATAWADDKTGGATFIAVASNGQRLGYVNVREGADEIADERCAYIALLAVVAEAEGKGVGQALLHAAERWSKDMGFSRVALDVFASNHRGQRFYETAGFRPETLRVIKRL
ncbi:GNAT family N-acetyltransferase [Brevundimonas lenta]|uniref:GNAT superfamily N-acetyltransferase n=1 Tax=Brevundimonas lenta TaxID=424796 RepID=A0A7W6JEE1_9CAUL|nr:GNAT family N-acetyltransferase [Brevundimonas lenta]MBB4083574.1 GNAT superfamily N-acetyltransferase [Brevundimonas lenta]